MTLLALESFDNYADGTDMRRRWGLQDSASINQNVGRYADGQGVGLPQGANQIITFPLPSTESELWVGFAYRLGPTASNYGSGHAILSLARGNNVQVSLLMHSGGGIAVRRSTTTDIADAVNCFPAFGQWYYVEVRCVISDSVGVVEIWVDGVQVLNATGLDTFNNSCIDGTIDHIRVGGSNNADPEWDDLYVLNTAGTLNNGRMGEVAIEMLIPNATGNRADFTASPAVANYLNVDDGAIPDDDTTYNHSSTVDDDELYNFANRSLAADTVPAVLVRNLVRKEEAGDRLIRALTRQNAVEGEGAAQGVGAEYRYHDHIFEENPDGPTGWTTTTLDAAEFGMTIEA